ncbi:uncharacterized protein At4g06598-like isoform X2 [Ziziphus jujuba]|uniref:Uncharacterized protein At4g06598-like isoform X2 n=1 Tax=Ziziphus jujuba TaxID=326968 RepID=A0A6P6FS99_ZIZJJ|nr:uncharacterized protein At4g06598-like isoform X2 [Ziziphus jujuba]
MENLNGSSNLGNLSYTGNQFQLPPRSPILFNFPPHFSSVVRAEGFPNPTHEFQAYHQRASSDSILQEEQPSWLEDLLEEPDTETQCFKGHRRSFSDSFAYSDATVPKASKNEERGFKDINAGTPNECHNHEHYHHEVSHALLHNTNRCKPSDLNEFWESSSVTAVTYSNGFMSTNDTMTLQTTEPSCISKKSDSIVKAVQEEPFVSSTVGSDSSQITNAPANNNDTKCSRQVRKLRYIVQLERHLQALQARGSEASAQLEFLDQYNLILGMENRALKYRLDTLQQQQLIKYTSDDIKLVYVVGIVEHEMLEREVARLRNLYQQQQQQQQQLQQQQSTRRRSKTRDLDCQHANVFVVRH